MRLVFAEPLKPHTMNSTQQTQMGQFWNAFHKRMLAFGLVPSLLFTAQVAFGFRYLEAIIPITNFFATVTLGFVAIIAVLISSAYLSFTYWMNTSKEA